VPAGLDVVVRERRSKPEMTVSLSTAIQKANHGDPSEGPGSAASASSSSGHGLRHGRVEDRTTTNLKPLAHGNIEVELKEGRPWGG
jgi:hypothetical protein